jgi:probable rRNA maturation factor
VIRVEINPSLQVIPAADLLERVALATLAYKAVEGDLTVVVSDDAQLQELNRSYLGIDAPTDVLSFPASEQDPETGRRYVGDVLISLPRAAQQASDAGHALEAELQLLVVHGVLHLLGHDHASEDEKARMWAVQTDILERLGLGDLQITE